MNDFEREDLTLAVIAERLRTIRLLSENGFENLHKELEPLRELPVKVEHLTGRIVAVEQRLDDVEDVSMRGVEWRRASLPIIFLTLALVLTGVGTILTQVH